MKNQKATQQGELENFRSVPCLSKTVKHEISIACKHNPKTLTSLIRVALREIDGLQEREEFLDKDQGTLKRHSRR